MASSIEDKVRAIIGYPPPIPGDKVRALVELIGDEKSKAYGLGFTDGERRMKRAWSY